jgi:uncharacterized membrane protein
MSDRLTLATAVGLPFVALAFHATMGTVGLISGGFAIGARKGGTLHRRSGLVFVFAMLAMGLTAVGIALYEHKSTAASGALAAYLIFTAWTTIRPLEHAGRHIDVALMLVACLLGLAGFAQASAAMGRPGRQIEGVPAGMQFFMSTIILLAAVGDVRMIRDGGVTGTRRLARHLWRMCFGLFIATGSFVAQLVRMSFMPAWTRSLPVILALAAGPLVVLLYWMWRVRWRRNLRGLVTARLIEA